MNSRFLSLVLCWLLGSGLPLLVTCPLLADDTEEYAAAEQEYFQLFPRGQFAAAERAARQLVAISRRSYPRNLPYDLCRVADCRTGLGHYAEAIELYHQALGGVKKMQPMTELERQALVVTMNNSLIGLGICHHNLADYEKAIEPLEQAIEWNVKVNKQPIQQAKAMNMLALTYVKQGESKKADALYTEITALIEPLVAREAKPGLASYALSTNLHNRAIRLKEAGRYDLAEPMLRKALRLSAASIGWENPETANVASTLASACYQQGRSEEAEPLLRYALKVQEAHLGPEHPKTLVAVGKLGDVVYFQGNFAAAESLFRRMIEGFERRLGGDHPELCSPLWMLGRSLAMQDRAAEAEPFFQKAVTVCQQHLGESHQHTALAQTWLAWGEAMADKGRESFERASQTLEIGKQQPLPLWMIAKLHDLRANYHWASGDRQQAFAEAELATKAIEQGRWHVGGAEHDRAAAFEDDIRSHYDRLVDWRAETGDIEQVFQSIETIKARTFLEELDMKGVDFLAGLSSAERTQKQLREAELRQALSAADQRFAELPALGPKPTREALERQQELAAGVYRARQELYEHLTEIRRASAVYQQWMTRDRQSPRMVDVQKSLLGAGEVLLMYRVGTNRSHVVVIRQDSVRAHELRIDDAAAKALSLPAGSVNEAQLAAALVTGKDSLLPALANPQSGTRPNEKLAALWTVLIPAADRADILAGKAKQLTIIPDGPLSLLPFDALIVADEGVPQYLLDAGPPIVYAPSVSVQMKLATRSAPTTQAKEPVLSLGDPAYTQIAVPQDAVDRRLGVTRAADQFRSSLKRLPHSGLESSWVKQHFDKAELATLQLIGPQATEAHLRRSISGRQIVHLACHGMADQNFGNLFGALAVAPGKSLPGAPSDPRDDGILSMSELCELDLSGCELTILSACETNYGPQQRGEGVWALSRGFLVAGSKRVVASNWVVDDQAGATLVSYFASYLTRSGNDPAARNYATALHNAKVQVRKDDRWKHPFYWSSLVLVGPK